MENRMDTGFTDHTGQKIHEADCERRSGMKCNKCDGTGFLNLDQVEGLEIFDAFQQSQEIIQWIESNNGHDVQVCDCCGDGENWYGIPGDHYNCDDPRGEDGPYAYNGGLCECH